MRESQEQGRRVAFGNFVQRAMDRWVAANGGGWRGFAEQVGMSTSSISRWIAGQWTQDPDRIKVENFCTALNIDPKIAFAILGWGVDAPERTEPAPEEDDDLRAVGRRLNDPNLTAEEERTIREVLRMLAKRRAS